MPINGSSTYGAMARLISGIKKFKHFERYTGIEVGFDIAQMHRGKFFGGISEQFAACFIAVYEITYKIEMSNGKKRNFGGI
jgi:hypothetical protein